MTRKLATAVLAILVALSVVTPAGAQSLDEQLSSVAQRIDALAGQIDATAAQRSEVASAILATRARMAELTADLDRVRDDLASVERDITVRRLHLDEVRSALAAQYERLAATQQDLTDTKEASLDWARTTYMNAGHGMSELAFSASELNQVALSLEYMNRITAENDAAVSRLEALQEQERRQRELIRQQELTVADEIVDLQEVEAAIVDLRDQLSARTAEVAAELETQRAVLDRYDHDIADFEGEIAALEKEQERIEQVIAEQQRQTGTKPSILVRPVPGAITSPFGPRWHPILGFRRMHTGVDMTAGYGTPIKAGAAGRVILASYNGGYGNTVVIDHGGGMTTLYAHQSELAVGFGDIVEAGQTVGFVGSTGLSTGPHLHFEVRIDGKPVDPAPYL